MKSTVLPLAPFDFHPLNCFSSAHLTHPIPKTVAPSTRKNYASASVYWQNWYQLRYAADRFPIPLPPPVVLQFLADHAPDGPAGCATMPAEVDRILRERGLRRAPCASLSGMRRYLAALSWMHSEAWSVDCGWHMPLDEPVVIRFVRNLTAMYVAQGSTPAQKDGALRNHLVAMLKTCDDDLNCEPLPVEWRQRERTLAAYRDRALLLFGWASGGRRRSELAAADMAHLERNRVDGKLAFTYRLGGTKAISKDQMTKNKPIKGTAAEALDAWLRHACIEDGRIFRSVNGGKLGATICDRSVARIIGSRASRAGLKGDWGGHSLRSGFITQASLDGIPDAETMAMTGHRTVQQLTRYHRESAELGSLAGDLFDRTKS